MKLLKRIAFCLVFCLFLTTKNVPANEPGSSKDGFSEFFQPTPPVENAKELQERSAEGRKGIFQKFSVDLSWIPSGGSNGLGMTRFHTSATFALPGPKLRWSKPSFFLLTPSFGYTDVDWKRKSPFPDSLYNASLNIAWIQTLNERWSMMLLASPGWASDGKESEDSVRCPVTFGMTWTPNKRWKVVFGAAYLDRSDLSFMPYGGLVWTPNDDVKVELMAPQARLAWRSYSDGLLSQFDRKTAIERWNYVGFGFGGGSWAVRSVDNQADFAMSREFSLLLGCERIKKGYYTCNLEIAYLFGRRMKFDHETQSTYKPDDSLLLRLKFAF